MNGPDGLRACFFGDLAPRRGQHVFVLPDLAFRDRPGALVLACPQRTAGMDEQHFERPLFAV